MPELVDIQEYDPEYALRVCRENGRVEAVVLLLRQRGAHEEAARLALTHGLRDLAKQVLSEGGLHGEVARAIWLELGLDGGAGGKESLSVHELVELLADSPDDVRLEDLMPRLDEHTVTPDLKQLVCNELEAHAAASAELRAALDATVARTQELVEIIANAKPPVVPDGASCGVCRRPVIARSGGVDERLVCFPCGHVFHVTCCGETSSCLLCGELVVDTIDLPF